MKLPASPPGFVYVYHNTPDIAYLLVATLIAALIVVKLDAINNANFRYKSLGEKQVVGFTTATMFLLLGIIYGINKVIFFLIAPGSFLIICIIRNNPRDKNRNTLNYLDGGLYGGISALVFYLAHLLISGTA